MPTFSIRVRLTVWYGALFTLLLLTVAFLSYALHVRGHYDDLDRVLVDTARRMAADVTTPTHGLRLLDESSGFKIAMRLYGARGSLQQSSQGAAGLVRIDPRTVLTTPAPPPFGGLVGVVPPLMPPVATTDGAFGLLQAPEQRWRLYMLPLYQQGVLTGYLEVLTPLGHLDHASHAFQIALLVIGLVGLATALLGSWGIAGQALLPVGQMVRTARLITRSGDVSHRIDLPAHRDELYALGETFNEMLASIEATSRVQQRFVADASHELRAPLTAIQGNIELLRRQRAMPEAEREEALADVEREAARLSRLVVELLALARADAGIAIKHAPVDLDALVLDVFHEARQLVCGQTLVLDPFAPVCIPGDADRLKQLVLIVLDNAIKYTPAGGRVTLGLQGAGDGALITVCDTGVGIAAADLPHVFERFYRADPARSRDPGGAGLGLPIAQWIVEQHSGTIAVQSAPGVGTTVTICLPARAAAF